LRANCGVVSANSIGTSAQQLDLHARLQRTPSLLLPVAPRRRLLFWLQIGREAADEMLASAGSVTWRGAQVSGIMQCRSGRELQNPAKH
jgi:hypothetical protein